MTFAARAMLLCVLLVGAAPTPPQPKLAALLTKMRTANGDVYAYHIVSSAQSDVRDTPVAFRSEMRGLRFWNSNCIEQVCAGTYFDGSHAYDVSVNRTTLARSPELQYALRGFRIVVSLAFLDPAFVRSGGKIVDEGSVTLDGRHVRRLLVGDTISSMTEVYVDPQTALPVAAGDLDEHDIVTFGDYRRVGTLRLPFRIDREGKPLERYQQRQIVDAPLDAPAGLAVTRAAPTSVPLDPAFRTPVVACSIGGVATRCLIDSGNSGLSVSLEQAEQLKASAVGAFTVSGLGRYATEVVRTGPLIVGNLTVPSAAYVVLTDIHTYGYDVVLGADVLAQMPLQLDYSRHVATFGGSEPDGSVLPLTFENFVPVVPLRLGKEETLLALDTGDESTINLSYEYYRAHPNLFSPTGTQGVAGVGGSSIQETGEISDVHIGAFSVLRQAIGATQTLKGTAHGHLGSGFLAHFALYLDYARSRAVLTPRPDDPAIHVDE